MTYDEIWERFVQKVADYKAMGVRMVVIDWPYEWSVLFAFYTHGVDAESIDKSRFLTPRVTKWASGFNDFDPDEIMQVLDVTDDFDEMSCYDVDGKFIVQQLL